MDKDVIYVMGDARCGSTILGIILGNHPSIECVGELHGWLKSSSFPKPGNSKSDDHTFWDKVRAEYTAIDYLLDLPKMLEAQIYVESFVRFPLTLLNLIPKPIIRVYESHLSNILQAVGNVSQKPIIMDISKNMGRASTLLRIAKGQIKIIHLVRDPRGVLWSQLKKNIEQNYLSPFQSILIYGIKNIFCHLVSMLAPNNTVLLVRYEDLVNHPYDEINRIGSFLGLSMNELALWTAAGNPLTIGHLIDGNRIRNETSISLKPDFEWQNNLHNKHRILAILLSWPFFFLYGYFNNSYKHV